MAWCEMRVEAAPLDEPPPRCTREVTSSARYRPRGARIFVVDDNAVMRRNLRMLLEAQDHWKVRRSQISGVLVGQMALYGIAVCKLCKPMHIDNCAGWVHDSSPGAEGISTKPIVRIHLLPKIMGFLRPTDSVARSPKPQGGSSELAGGRMKSPNPSALLL
jgi:hypothetical protein